MKKFSFLMALALFLMSHVYVYGDAQLNPYAYDVKAQLSGTNIELSYKLNAPATSTDIIVYCNDVEIGRQQITEAAANTVGSHAATVNLSSYAQAGNCTVGILVHGTSPTAPTQISTNYSFFHGKGVAVDTNPLSPYFGRILTDEGMMSVPASGYHSSTDKDGIYAFDAAFQPIHNGTGYAFKGGLTYTAKMSNGSTNAYTPYRIRISSNGRIFVSMQDDQKALIYEATPDLQTFTPIISNVKVNGMPAVNQSLDLKENPDGSISLLTLNCNARGIGFNNNGWELVEYTIPVSGDISSQVIMDSIALNSVINGDDWTTTLTAANTNFQYAADGGYWYINSRSNAFEAMFAHIKNNGTTWDLVMSKLDGTKTGEGDFYGGGGLIEIGNKIYVGMTRQSSTIGRMGVFTVDYSGANTVITKDTIMKVNLIGRNLNDFALDYANNLYTCGNSNEKIVCIALPYSGEVETPVALPSNVVLPLTEHLYEIGTNNAWATNAGVEMDVVAPNVFEKEISFADANSYFTLSSALGADWAAINAYRYGADNNNEPISNGLVKSLHLGWGNSFTIPAGKYRITADLNNLTVTVKQLWDNLYVYDDVVADWYPTPVAVAVQDVEENIFEGTYMLPAEKHILFAYADVDNWTDLNATQVRINSGGDYWLNGDSEAGILTEGSNAACFLSKAGGVYKFRINLDAKTITITQLSAYLDVTTAGYATYFNSAKAYEMPTGMTGYAFNIANGLVEAYTAGETVPSNMPLVLEAAAGPYELIFTDDVAPKDLASQLHGSDEDYPTSSLVVGSYKFYGLSLNSAGEASSVGFYYMEDEGAAFTNKAHKAFLAVPAATPAPSRILFNENNATNIQAIEGQEKAVKFIENGQLYILKEGVVYDAMGRVIR